jgi:hypothetical protein
MLFILEIKMFSGDDGENIIINEEKYPKKTGNNISPQKIFTMPLINY